MIALLALGCKRTRLKGKRFVIPFYAIPLTIMVVHLLT